MTRENFLEETGNSEDLLNAMYSNRKIHFTADYLGKSHSCYVQPISTLPLYLITFFDDSYNNSINLQITSITFIILFLLMIVLFILVIVSRLVDYKKSELKRNLDIVEWLRPEGWKFSMYKKVMVTNLFAILLIIVSCLMSNSVNTIFLIFIVVSVQIIAANFSTNVLARQEMGKDYLYGQLVLGLFILALIFYLAFKIDADIFYLVINTLLLIVFNVFLILNKNIFPNSSQTNFKFFYFYLLTWLFIIVVVPIIIFYIKFYNYEMRLDTAHKLYSYAESTAERNYSIDKFYNDYMNKSFYQFKKARKLKGIYFIDSIYRMSDPVEFNNIKKYNLKGEAWLTYYFI